MLNNAENHSTEAIQENLEFLLNAATSGSIALEQLSPEERELLALAEAEMAEAAATDSSWRPSEELLKLYKKTQR